ncbi:right-handed parallel beta-helix repeat-containing protein [Ferviditalea candida]|uniref:NosD domain-containing protein n=1 Tax=Ferviditalea candida TaxID=3108399 RepID=A0ABU5ZJH4_9BACL|nr:NosD domain-containing protein [Paenibacillaceae bacterium T2]
MIKRLFPAMLMLFGWLLSSFTLSAEQAEALETNARNSLQSLIDRTTAGGELTIPPGQYEGPIIINKPIALQGNGNVTITGQGGQPVITVNADRVTMTGIHVVDELNPPDIPAIVLQGSGHVLEQLQIQTSGSGIQLRKAHKSLLRELRISGLGNQSGSGKQLFRRGNGIDLWGSHDNRIVSCTISGMQDGIYLESSEANRILDNTVSDSRYATHLMFTKDTIVKGNVGIRNVTGLMVMGTNRTQIEQNRYYKQSQNVNSQGLLLYDVKNAVVRDNHMEGNRVGIYMELSSSNIITDNTVAFNFIGLQAIESSRNKLVRNSFISNVIQAQAKQSGGNELDGNYWDDTQNIDLQGDGQSDLPYRISPFFLTLTNAAPSFQLFFGSPGIVFLESLFHAGTDQWLTDAAPLIRPAADPFESVSTHHRSVGFIFSFLLFLISILIITYWGVLRK